MIIELITSQSGQVMGTVEDMWHYCLQKKEFQMYSLSPGLTRRKHKHFLYSIYSFDE